MVEDDQDTRRALGMLVAHCVCDPGNNILHMVMHRHLIDQHHIYVPPLPNLAMHPRSCVALNSYSWLRKKNLKNTRIRFVSHTVARLLGQTLHTVVGGQSPFDCTSSVSNAHDGSIS